MRWMHRVRLYPRAGQVERLKFMLDVTRQLYNAMLEQRRWLWVSRRLSVGTKAQYRELTALREDDRRIAAVYRECEDAVLHRLDLAFAAFFRRMKGGEIPGYPRYKAAFAWHQLEFPHGDRALKLSSKQDRLRVPGVGWVRLRKGREVPAFGRAFVVEKNGRRWYAVFESEREPQPLQETGRIIGVDGGVHVLAATSEGVLVRNARSFGRHRRIVTRLQRELDAVTLKDERGRCLNRRDPKRKKAVLRLARANEREANVRLDHAHHEANRIVASGDVLALEKLDLRRMTRSAKGTLEQPGRNVRAKAALNRVMLDAGFGLLRRLIVEKAARAARTIVWVDARYSSRTCGRCLHVSAKSRRKRRFRCVRCGWYCQCVMKEILNEEIRAA